MPEQLTMPLAQSQPPRKPDPKAEWFQEHVTIAFDGGCRGNPGPSYGSFEVRLNGNQILGRNRVEFGPGTRNTAEFQACQQALEELLDWLKEHGRQDPGKYWVQIYTDSTIVRNRLMGRNRIFKKRAWADSSRRMFERAEKALSILRQFGGFKVTWQPRERNVERFGH
jgi:ribonuclease HI